MPKSTVGGGPSNQYDQPSIDEQRQSGESVSSQDQAPTEDLVVEVTSDDSTGEFQPESDDDDDDREGDVAP